MITPVAYIISRINARLHSREISAVYALAATLRIEEAEVLCDYLIEQNDTIYEEEVCRTLLEILQDRCHLDCIYPRYRPIGRVIAEARMVRLNSHLLDELQKRFDTQSFEDQCSILRFFLSRIDVNDSYRHYAYNYLERCWDDAFAPDIKRCWLTYHDCSSLVIRHLSETFVLEHTVELGADRYKELCLRLCKNPAFWIDRDRLSDRWDYLEIMQRKGEPIDETQLLSEFMESLREEFYDIENCVSKMIDTADNIVGEEELYASMKLLPSVRDFIFGLSRLGLKESLLRFLLWDQTFRDEHFARLNREYDDTGEVRSSRAYYRLFCQMVAARLNEQSPSIEFGIPK